MFLSLLFLVRDFSSYDIEHVATFSPCYLLQLVLEEAIYIFFLLSFAHLEEVSITRHDKSRTG